MKILVIHAHWKNRGDESAIRAMIDSFQIYFPNSEISLMLMTDNIIFNPFQDIKIVKQCFNLKRNPDSILSTSLDILFILLSFGNIGFSKNTKSYINEVKNSDIVIHAPGGPNIGDIYSSRIAIPEILYILRLSIATLNKKPIFFYAPSMGPFENKIKNIYRKYLLKKSNLIVVREEKSHNFLRDQLNINSIVTIDSALQHDINPKYLTKYSEINDLLQNIKSKKFIGLTITSLSWHPSYKDDLELKGKIISSIMYATEKIIGKGYHIILIPQIFESENTEEDEFIRIIQNIDPEKIFVLPKYIDSYGQQAIIMDLYCIIGMRYHPNIFAANAKVPSIAIIYEHKTKGFMEKMNNDKLTIDVKEITGEKIVDKLNYLEENYSDIKDNINIKSNQCKLLAKETTRYIANKYRNLGN